MDNTECQSQNASDVPKVSNLNVGASDDEYARLKVNNFDVSMDAGKRDAYAKFEEDFNKTLSSGIEDSDNSHMSVTETDTCSSEKEN